MEADETWEQKGEQKLYRVSDATGKLEFSFVAKGKDCTRDKLDSADAFIFDVGFEVFGIHLSFLNKNFKSQS